MAGDALLPSPQGRDRTFPDLLDLFAAVMLGQLTPDDAGSRMATDARRSARSAITSARAPVGSQEILALRSIYDQVRALGPVPAPEATRKNAVLGRTRAARAMDALLHLRHRQRAALILHDLGALPPAAVASILGLTTRRAHEVVDAGRVALQKRLPRPVNVRHVLRDAAGRLLCAQPATVLVDMAAPIVRGVVETLLAPVPGPNAAPAVGSRGWAPADITDRLLRALEESPTDLRTVIGPAAARPLAVQVRGPARTRWWLAAACAVLAVAVVLPAAARAPQRVDAPTTKRMDVPASVRQAATRVRVAPEVRRIVVARGDSLWAIAVRVTGDGTRWREIWRLNANTSMSGGRRFTDPDLILPGWSLRAPA